MRQAPIAMCWAAGLALALATAGAPGRASAQDADYRRPTYASTTKGPQYAYSEGELRARKLARGFANVTLAVAEIPNQGFREAYRTSPVTGFVIGAGKGVYKGLKRFVIGFWEMATFYAPLENKYQPYIEPEVVFMEYIY